MGFLGVLVGLATLNMGIGYLGSKGYLCSSSFDLVGDHLTHFLCPSAPLLAVVEPDLAFVEGW